MSIRVVRIPVSFAFRVRLSTWIRACFRPEGKAKRWIPLHNSGDGSVAEPSLPSTERLNLAALALADTARLLAAAGGGAVTVEMLQAAVDGGAPTLPDGRVDLVEPLAWLEKELAGKA
jgi:hypothetical protein